VWRVVGFPNPLSRERDIGAFLGLGGPISCLTNATVGVTTLLIAGKIPWAAYFHNWWTWWIGDTIGVLIVTPLLLSWLAEPRDAWRRRRLSVAMPLVGAFALAIFVFVHTSGQERERLRLTFERQAENLAQTLADRFDRNLGMLSSIARLYASSQDVTRDEFHTFVGGIFERNAGIQALSWDRRLPDAERESYEGAVRQEGYAGFQITEQDAQGQLVRAASRPEYVVVSYIEPYTGNEKALGYDVASNPDRLNMLQHARDAGRPMATGRLMPVQETAHQFGLLIFLPIYGRGPPPATVEERRRRLLGYATGVFRIGGMIEASLQNRERQGIMLRIEDEAAPADQRLLYDSQGEGGSAFADARGKNPAWMHWDATVELAGRRWTLHFTPTLEYLAARQSLQPWTVLLGGMVLTSLLGAFLLIVTGRRVLVEQVVAERTSELSQTNAALAREIAERQQAEDRFLSIAQSAPEAIISADRDGNILTWNNGAQAIFGYTPDEIVGHPLARLMPERYRAAHQRGLERIRTTAESDFLGKVLALHGLRQDGQEFPLELTLSTWTTAEGRFYGGIIRDVSERQRTEGALRESEERFRGAFDNAPIGLALVAPDGRWLQVNRSLCEIVGYTEHELLATTFQAITYPDDLATDLDYVRRMLAGEIHAYQMEKRYFHKRGHIVWILLSVSLVRDTRGHPLYFISQIQDITQRKRVEEELKQTAVELTRSNAELSQFAYIASHDLQEPLRAVAGCVQLLQHRYQHSLDARADELITHAVSGVTRMQTLIEDLLTFSRVARQRSPFEMTDCAVILHGVLANLEVAIRESSAVVTSGVLPTVRADQLLLGQVFQNLIGNAIKFRNERPPAIHVAAKQEKAAWIFSVRDNGIGIEPQYYERIFEVFQRLHSRREYPGTGIGLAICKKIVERHGGHIWVTSEPGNGATFCFTIPDLS
jgi:PAS domain S-box-containing protein